MWYTLQSGIVYGPYGSVGFASHIQRDDLVYVAKTCSQLLHWAKQRILSLL